jgi:hypothetical protein
MSIDQVAPKTRKGANRCTKFRRRPIFERRSELRRSAIVVPSIFVPYRLERSRVKGIDGSPGPPCADLRVLQNA